MATNFPPPNPTISSMRPLLCLVVFAVTFAFGTCFAQEPVDFATQILPLLSDRCTLCHGPDEEARQADLRLDAIEAVGAETENGGLDLVIAPGDADASELIRRIVSNDEGEKMPPPDSNLSLSSQEIDLLKRWINQGAQWDVHWSFRKLAKPAVPLSPLDPYGSEIDSFVDRELVKKNLAPTEQADDRTLLRRLSLDLTGLPPSQQELGSFLSDSSPTAYERAVDRLLASPYFGERLAVPWLDAARYADTYGYQADVYREVWPWRDWVIDAMQANMPYDQFLTWQLAGDLIPNATQESKLATAFNRLHRQTNEGGSVEEEFRAEYVSDRVNTLGTAILGLTLECSRCHDHKYDPISQENYYQLAAFFANIDESGLYSHFTNYVPTPALDLPSKSQAINLEAARLDVVNAEQKLTAAIEQAAATQADSSGDKPHARIPDLLAHYSFGDSSETIDTKSNVEGTAELKLSGGPKSINGPNSPGVQLDGENGFTTTIGGDWDWYQPFTIGMWIKPTMHHERAVIWHRSRAWTDAASCGYELLLEDGRLSAALIHFWPGDAVRVKAVEPAPIDQWSYVCVTSDGSGKAAGLKIFVNGQEAAATEVVRDSLKRTIRGGGVNELAVGNRFRDRGFKNGQVDELSLYSRDLSDAEIAELYAGLVNANEKAEGVDESNSELLQALSIATNQTVREARQQLFEARKRLASIQDSIPSIMTMRESPGLHDTHVLIRGQYDRLGQQVAASVPEALCSSDSFQNQTNRDTLTRLDLANWLTDSRPEHRHPLVARVVVNRVWQMFFDQGIVATPEDFGLQGQPPTHPQLLDFLAATFIDEGWDLKRLVWRIVTSKAYKRSSIAGESLLEADPENKWLARGPSSRLPVEAIRDAALAASGLLDKTIGGPSVKPYQPSGLWEEKSGAAYQRQVGAESHRRSLYTIWKRTSPPPSMTIFDAPGREVCVAGRTITHTPLQSLVLLNDDQFVEAARGVAYRILSAPQQGTDDSIKSLFEILLARPPSLAEKQVIENLINEQTEYFGQSTEQTDAFLSIGDFDYKKTISASDMKAADLAAWTVAAQTLMNLDEWVTR